MSDHATVTLLFTDLVGSTELLGRMGDEGAEQLRRAHFRLLREAVAARGGQEVKSLGDGLMVVFPGAVDAVGCAVAMQQAVARHNRRQAEEAALQVRVGLHVGEPIRDEEDYFGTPVVVAKRLCDAAAGGQILASELVSRLVGQRAGFPFHDVGELQLKGLATPVAACEVRWERPPETAVVLPTPLLVTDRAPFVGRGEELERLRRSWERARQGQPHAAFLTGEAGMGKTRLASELARVALADGGWVLYGRCDEETLVSYQPFVEALRQYVAACPPDELAAQVEGHRDQLARLVPDLSPHAPGEPEHDPETARYLLFEAVARLLAEAAAAAPLLLILDDLHWADRPTLLLLRHLLRSAQPRSVVVLGTYRDSEVDRSHPLTATLNDLRREGTLERVALEALDEEAVGELVAGLVGGIPALGLAHVLHERTGGNPFFVQETARHLAETGGLLGAERSPGGFAEQLDLPEGVKEVVGRRLARLGPETNRVLSLASVVGSEFGLGLLAALAEMPEDMVLEALEEAMAARLVEELPGALDRFAFAQAVIRATLYEQLAVARRARLHGRVGEELEALHASDLEPHLAELAHHFALAAPVGAADKAIEYGRRAAERAASLFAYEDATVCYQRALQALETSERSDQDALRCELLLGLGTALYWAGEVPEAWAPFLEAAELARAMAAPRQLARAALGRAARWGEVGDSDRAIVDLLAEALSALGPEEPQLRVRLLSRLAAQLYFNGTFDDLQSIEGLSEEAVSLARPLDDGPTLAVALHARHFALMAPEQLDERLSVAGEILQMAEQAGDRDMILQGHHWLLRDLLEAGDVAGVDRQLDAFTRLASELRLPLYRYATAVYQAMRALLDGRFSEAERLAQEALVTGQRVREQDATQAFGVQLALLRREQGRLDELVSVIEGFAAQYPELIPWRCGLAFVYSELDRLQDARAELDQLAVGGLAELPRDAAWASNLTLLAEVCAAVGDVGRAAEVYELLAPFARRNVVLGGIAGVACVGSQARSLGVLATVMGRWDAAEAHFAAALEDNHRMGARAWMAHTRNDLADMLLARAAPGDADRARELLRDALGVARDLGMPSLAKKATSALSSLERPAV